MTAAIWSTPPDTAALDFPALTLIRFMHNHHLLQILDRPTWLTVKEGSHSYVNRIIDSLPAGSYHHSMRIQSASTRDDGKVHLTTEMGETLEFDHVVFACHADTTLKILERGEGITEQERKVLGGFEFSKNRAVLHSDPAVSAKQASLSADQPADASRFPSSCRSGDRLGLPGIISRLPTDPSLTSTRYLCAFELRPSRRCLLMSAPLVCRTYWMNLLQSISEKEFGPVLVTLNPPFDPKPELVAQEYWYEHPLFSELVSPTIVIPFCSY